MAETDSSTSKSRSGLRNFGAAWIEPAEKSKTRNIKCSAESFDEINY